MQHGVYRCENNDYQHHSLQSFAATSIGRHIKEEYSRALKLLRASRFRPGSCQSRRSFEWGPHHTSHRLASRISKVSNHHLHIIDYIIISVRVLQICNSHGGCDLEISIESNGHIFRFYNFSHRNGELVAKMDMDGRPVNIARYEHWNNWFRFYEMEIDALAAYALRIMDETQTKLIRRIYDNFKAEEEILVDGLVDDLISGKLGIRWSKIGHHPDIKWGAFISYQSILSHATRNLIQRKHDEILNRAVQEIFEERGYKNGNRWDIPTYPYIKSAASPSETRLKEILRSVIPTKNNNL